MNPKGPFVILSGPSGVGKTLFVKKSLERFPQFSNPVSFTTRSPRKEEKEGVFYNFVTKKQFELLKKQGAFLEWEKVYDEFYATSKKEVERLWKQGKAIIRDLDTKGCQSIKKIFPHSLSVFIYPPSIEELRKRILKRDSTISKKLLEKRLLRATEEIAQGREYDFKIVNDCFEDSWAEFQKILSQSLIF